MIAQQHSAAVQFSSVQFKLYHSVLTLEYIYPIEHPEIPLLLRGSPLLLQTSVVGVTRAHAGEVEAVPPEVSEGCTEACLLAVFCFVSSCRVGASGAGVCLCRGVRRPG